MGGKSGGGGGPQEITQTTSNLPSYAQPYFTKALERTLYESARPYEAFPGQRIADFTPQERSAMQGMEGLAAAGSPKQFLHASNIAQNIGYGGGLGPWGQGPPVGIAGTTVPPPFMPPPGRGFGRGSDIAGRFDPQDIASQYKGPDIDPGYAAGDISQRYQAGARQAGYTGRPGDVWALGAPGGGPGIGPPGGQFGPGFTPGTVADPQTIERYMNPYQQMVTDVEKREAARQSKIMGTQIGQQAAQTGGLGGYREAIIQAERERNLGQQLGDIQTRGSQAAFQQAQQAFEADRAARLQAESRRFKRVSVSVSSNS